MRSLYTISLTFVILWLSLLSFSTSVEIDKNILLTNVLRKIKSITTLSYTFKNTERINNKLLSGEQLVKLQVSPLKCKIVMVLPDKGAVLVYPKDSNSKQAVYKPNGFPYTSINLDPMGDLIRNNNHHTIHELGFTPIAKLLKLANKTYTVSLLNDVEWNSKKCYQIELKAKINSTISYTVKKGETIRSIAVSRNINEYKILELNNSLNSFNQKLKENTSIKIPTSYADDIILYIDKESFLPIYQEYKDQKGLFEKYEFTNLKINPVFDPESFNPKL